MRRQRSTSPDGYSKPYYHHHRQTQQYQQRCNTPPRRAPNGYRRRREDTPYTIPSTAPRLQVPHDLPVDVTAFLDLVAFYVVQGGPTTEEEIMKREENNKCFAFLRSPWNNPMQLYYRWRIYSMLQGDTLLKWRTEPYQIERGSEAYVWVPPPAIPSGPECLLNAFASDLSYSKNEHGGRGCEGKSSSFASGNVSAASVSSSASPSNPHPVPSALWLSRMSISECTFFVTLDKQAAEEWRELLRMEDVVAEAIAGSRSLEERTSAVAAALLDNERIAQRMVFAVEHQNAALHLMSLALDEVLQLAYDSARSLRAASGGGGRYSAESSGVKVKSGDDNCNGVNSALDAAVRCCKCLSYLFTLNDIGKNGGALPLSEEEVANYVPLWDGQYGGTGNTTTGSGVGGSSGGGNNSNNTSIAAVSGGADVASAASGSLLPPPPPISSPPSSSPVSTVRQLNRALEKIMPTLIEATLVLALCTVEQYGSLQVDNARETVRSSAKPPGAEEMEGILPLDIDHAAYVHVQAKLSGSRGIVSGVCGTVSSISPASSPSTATTLPSSPSPLSTANTATALRKEDRDAVCMIAMLLMSWLKHLCASWAEDELIGNRCWSTLLTKYAYLLAHPIETT